MIQGTGSNVGKSLLVSGLCRLLTRYGLRVLPFKPQNMSNNAAVTVDGGEIGRAQAVQAQACRAVPSVHMNPVLLKPQTIGNSQIIVGGDIWGQASSRNYQKLKTTFLPAILASFYTIAAQADLILIEGAGAVSEINLRLGDIANMGFAETENIPVILVGDIDHGGVIASLVGSYTLLSRVERKRVKGFLINKFRGDKRLLEKGLSIITDRTGWPSLGVIPWLEIAQNLPDEDSMALRVFKSKQTEYTNPIRIVVLLLPHIANFDDFSPLQLEKDVSLLFSIPGTALPGDADVLILPGSKATLADLAILRTEGWDTDIIAHWRRGGMIIGVCAGYQMLGHIIRDPHGLEGRVVTAPGLGLLNVETTLVSSKVLRTVYGYDTISSTALHGYEMHVGRTNGPDCTRPWFLMEDGQVEGACSVNGQVRGSYIHGLFTSDDFRHSFLRSLRFSRQKDRVSFALQIEGVLDALADHLEHYINIYALLDSIFNRLRV